VLRHRLPKRYRHTGLTTIPRLASSYESSTRAFRWGASMSDASESGGQGRRLHQHGRKSSRGREIVYFDIQDECEEPVVNRTTPMPSTYPNTPNPNPPTAPLKLLW